MIEKVLGPTQVKAQIKQQLFDERNTDLDAFIMQNLLQTLDTLYRRHRTQFPTSTSCTYTYT